MFTFMATQFFKLTSRECHFFFAANSRQQAFADVEFDRHRSDTYNQEFS